MREQKKEKKKGKENAPVSEGKKADQERIKELTRKRKEMQREIDELKGNTVKENAVGTLVFLVLFGLLFGIFVGMVKQDMGGVTRLCRYLFCHETQGCGKSI